MHYQGRPNQPSQVCVRTSGLRTRASVVQTMIQRYLGSAKDVSEHMEEECVRTGEYDRSAADYVLPILRPSYCRSRNRVCRCS